MQLVQLAKRALAAVILIVASTGLAHAHAERFVASPVRPGPTPDPARVNPNRLVVCKPTSRPTDAELADIEARLAAATSGAEREQAQRELDAWHRNRVLFEECCFEHIQDAVDAAGDDTDILVMPGVYREEPSREFPSTEVGDLPDGSYSFEYHVANPHDANLIAILGKRNITIEGTGADPRDVLIDVGFAKDNGIRCDRCTGVIYRNFWLRDAGENGVYTIDSDGYVYDRVIGEFSRDYQLFAFASDNGLFVNSEAAGGSDSGFYVGASAEPTDRFSAILRGNLMHTNAIGFSGTNGNRVLLEDNEITNNAMGLTFDSEPTGHANFPQKDSVIRNNRIHDNNLDIYAPDSPIPPGGPGYSFIRYPVGSGCFLAGVNLNLFTGNLFYGNRRYACVLIANGAGLEGFNGSENEFRGNVLGIAPDGTPAPNGTDPIGVDWWWDEHGANNCWQDNGPQTSDPDPIPDCSLPNQGAGNPTKSGQLLDCLIDDPNDPGDGQTMGDCMWGNGNQGPTENVDEAECGNGVIDLGEDCDPGTSGGGAAALAGESCQSLARGGGLLGCREDCLFDTSACEIPGDCATLAIDRMKVRGFRREAGRQIVRIRAVEIDGAGRTFDPTTEETTIVLGGEGASVLTMVIAAGDPRWRARPASAPRRFVYRDPSGGVAGLRRVVIRPADRSGALDGILRADIKIRNAALAALDGNRAARLGLRVADDCWDEVAPCQGHSGRRLNCQTHAPAGCPAP